MSLLRALAEWLGLYKCDIRFCSNHAVRACGKGYCSHHHRAVCDGECRR